MKTRRKNTADRGVVTYVQAYLAKVPAQEHDLIVVSLHDLQAYCICGDWSLVRTTTDDDRAEDLREDAEQQFKTHVEFAQRREG